MSSTHKNLTYYIPVTGEIVATVSGEIQPSLSHLNYIDGLYPADIYYISGGVPKERRKMLLNISGLTITGIPHHSKVTINGEAFIIDDGFAEITRPGAIPISVKLEHINYIKEEIVL